MKNERIAIIEIEENNECNLVIKDIIFEDDYKLKNITNIENKIMFNVSTNENEELIKVITEEFKTKPVDRYYIIDNTRYYMNRKDLRSALSLTKAKEITSKHVSCLWEFMCETSVYYKTDEEKDAVILAYCHEKRKKYALDKIKANLSETINILKDDLLETPNDDSNKIERLLKYIDKLNFVRSNYSKDVYENL